MTKKVDIFLKNKTPPRAQVFRYLRYKSRLQSIPLPSFLKIKNEKKIACIDEIIQVKLLGPKHYSKKPGSRYDSHILKKLIPI